MADDRPIIIIKKKGGHGGHHAVHRVVADELQQAGAGGGGRIFQGPDGDVEAGRIEHAGIGRVVLADA